MYSFYFVTSVPEPDLPISTVPSTKIYFLIYCSNKWILFFFFFSSTKKTFPVLILHHVLSMQVFWTCLYLIILYFNPVTSLKLRQ